MLGGWQYWGGSVGLGGGRSVLFLGECLRENVGSGWRIYKAAEAVWGEMKQENEGRMYVAAGAARGECMWRQELPGENATWRKWEKLCSYLAACRAAIGEQLHCQEILAVWSTCALQQVLLGLSLILSAGADRYVE